MTFIIKSNFYLYMFSADYISEISYEYRLKHLQWNGLTQIKI